MCRFDVRHSTFDVGASTLVLKKIASTYTTTTTTIIIIVVRFGHCACVVKLQLIDVNRHVMILFGGVNLEADLADMWLIILD